MRLLLCLILITFCNKKTDNNNMNYFDFDEVDYYHKDIIENDIFKEYEKAKLTGYDNSYLKIVHTEYPTKLNDTEFIKNLIKYDYVNKKLNKLQHNQVNEIFSKNDCSELTANGCVSIYRDIFIFKKEKEIVGIAKVCFECRMAYIIGSKQNWDSFGECGDYEKLKLLIK